jgi:hypothetical protein
MAETADSADTTAAPGAAAAGSAMSAAGMPMLRLGAYEGPLDLLLDLARAQRVDFASLSMPDLAEQFGAAVEAAIAGARVPLGQMGDWLVVAATLVALRARLLLPAGAPERRDADREAAALRRQLADRAAVQCLADWLEQRPQLGRDVFARGWTPQQEEAGQPPAADITELLGRACDCWHSRCARRPTSSGHRRCGGCRRRWRTFGDCWPTGHRRGSPWPCWCRHRSKAVPVRCSGTGLWPAPWWRGWNWHVKAY